jgi:hypothetical protein
MIHLLLIFLSSHTNAPLEISRCACESLVMFNHQVTVSTCITLLVHIYLRDLNSLQTGPIKCGRWYLPVLHFADERREVLSGLSGHEARHGHQIDYLLTLLGLRVCFEQILKNVCPMKVKHSFRAFQWRIMSLNVGNSTLLYCYSTKLSLTNWLKLTYCN